MAQSKKKVLPHHPQDTESSEERIMLHGKELARIMVDGNDKVTPDKLIAWINKQDTTGWTNLRIKAVATPFEPYVELEHTYVVIVGDRMETDKEYQARLESVVSKWQREYEEFLRNKDFYENNPVGQARLEYIEAKKKRPINRPRA